MGPLARRPPALAVDAGSGITGPRGRGSPRPQLAQAGLGRAVKVPFQRASLFEHLVGVEAKPREIDFDARDQATATLFNLSPVDLGRRTTGLEDRTESPPRSGLPKSD